MNSQLDPPDEFGFSSPLASPSRCPASSSLSSATFTEISEEQKNDELLESFCGLSGIHDNSVYMCQEEEKSDGMLDLL